MGVDRGKRHEGSAAKVKQRDSELEHVAQPGDVRADGVVEAREHGGHEDGC